jgi:enediyne biosynthesis protein E4
MRDGHPRPAVAALAGALAAGLATLSPLPLQAAGEPWFRDTRDETGPDFRHHTGARPERPYFPEIAGGGGALVDVDGDGDLDAYLVQSGSLYEPGGDVCRNRLYLNDGTGRFTDATDGSGADDRGFGMGVAAGDYDGDGDTDLYVTNVRANALLRNDGGGHFTDVTAAAAVGDTSWSTSAAFADLDLDGDLDLYVANYVNWTMATELDCPHPTGNLDYCDPTHYNAPSRDTLYRNEGNGTFTDVSESAGMGGTYGNGLGVMCADVTGDDLPEIIVANDRVFDNLWVNHGDLTFTEDALFRGCACDDDGYPKAGMGMSIIDYDNDGDRDFLVVNYAKETDSFYENDGSGFFLDRAAAIGVGFKTKQFTRFGVGFGDFDNDGRTDIYYANGRATRPRADYRTDGDPFAEPNLLFRGLEGGKVEEVLPRGGNGPAEYTSRAAVFGDVDNDGGLDVLVVNRDGPVQMLHNVKKDRGNWIGFRVRQPSGGDALGATVVVTLDGQPIQRDALSAQSYLAASDPRPRFGLGRAAGVQAVKVHWPGGAWEEFGDFPAGAYHDLVRGTGKGS